MQIKTSIYNSAAVDRLRAELKFDGPGALTEAIRRDVELTRQRLAESQPPEGASAGVRPGK